MIRRLVRNWPCIRLTVKGEPKSSASAGRAEPGSRKEVGREGENLASDFLKRKGYKILHRNYRCRLGEIDIIARAGDCLVFVEVRTRSNFDYGTPEESVTISKQEKLISLADTYIQTLDCTPPSWRIDVVAVELGPDNSVLRLEHIENAVG